MAALQPASKSKMACLTVRHRMLVLCLALFYRLAITSLSRFAEAYHFDHSSLYHSKFVEDIFRPLTPEFWIVWVLKNKDCMLFAVPESMPQKRLSRQGFHLNYFLNIRESNLAPRLRILPRFD